jgi:hypothetical protein
VEDFHGWGHDWLQKSGGSGDGGVDLSELRMVKLAANQLLGDSLSDPPLSNSVSDRNLPHFL